jgi:hypothetical protein
LVTKSSIGARSMPWASLAAFARDRVSMAHLDLYIPVKGILALRSNLSN